MWSDGEYIYEFVGYYGGVQEALDICRSVKAVKKGE
jgi:hypothetical protein